MLRLLTFLLGPIFAKEMIEVSRRARYYFNRSFYGSVILFASFIVWDSNDWKLRRGYGEIEVMAEVAQELFLTVSCVQCAAVFLFVPVFLCGVISSEREERTLDLLFTTTLADREIVLGKLISRLVVAALLMFSSMPVLSLITLFGGVDPTAVWQVQMGTLVAMLYAGGHAIYFSATSRSPMGALLRTYWWMALWLGGVPAFIIAILANTTPSPFVPVSQFFLSLLACINPISPFVLAIEPRLANFVTGFGPWLTFVVAAVPVSWAVLLIVQAVRHVRTAPEPWRWADRVPGVQSFRRFRSGLGRVIHTLDWVAVTWQRRGQVANPLWQRARLAPVYDREGYLRRVSTMACAAAAAFFILFATVEPRDLFDEEGAMVFLGFTWGGVGLLTIVASATSLVGDRRRGLLELMLAAPLHPAEFVDGSLLAVVEHLRRILWLPIVLTGLLALIGDPQLVGSLCSFITAFLFLSLVLLAGVLMSLTARSMATALLFTFLFPITALILTPLLTGVFEAAAGPILWFSCAIFLPLTYLWIRRSASTAAVGCHFIVVHLTITAITSCWTFDGRRDEFPLLAMHPGALMIIPLDERIPNEFRGHAKLYWVIPTYWVGLVANFVLARRWMIRHFDRLAGRTLNMPDEQLRALWHREWSAQKARLFRGRPIPLPPANPSALAPEPLSDSRPIPDQPEPARLK